MPSQRKLILKISFWLILLMIDSEARVAVNVRVIPADYKQQVLGSDGCKFHRLLEVLAKQNLSEKRVI